MSSRRGGARQSESRRNQPSPAPSQPAYADAAGRGRGRPSRGGAPAPAPAQAHAPPPSSAPAPAMAAPSASAAVAATSSSSLPPVSVSTEALSSEIEEKLTLQSRPAPSSSKAIRFPDRPGYGRLGRKIQVRANHFQLQVAEKDFHHYDVSIVYSTYFLFCLFFLNFYFTF